MQCFNCFWYALAVGWFHPSSLLGMQSPSMHLFSSSHHGVLSRHVSFPPVPAGLWVSVVFTHSAAFADMRALIQSMVRADLLSSSSLVAFSICSRSENRKAKVVCGTEVSEVVLVVTAAR